MNSTMFIANLLLPVFTIITLSLIINPKWFKNIIKDTPEHPMILLMLSIIHIVAGSAIVLAHNIWSWTLPVVITLLGWIMVIKGAAIMLLPKKVPAMIGWAGRKNMIYITAAISALITIALFLLSSWR